MSRFPGLLSALYTLAASAMLHAAAAGAGEDTLIAARADLAAAITGFEAAAGRCSRLAEPGPGTVAEVDRVARGLDAQVLRTALAWLALRAIRECEGEARGTLALALVRLRQALAHEGLAPDDVNRVEAAVWGGVWREFRLRRQYEGLAPGLRRGLEAIGALRRPFDDLALFGALELSGGEAGH